MTKYSNKIMNLNAENKRALLNLRSKETSHQMNNTPVIIEDRNSKYKSKDKKQEAALLKNQLNDCRDTLLTWQKLSKIKDVGSDAKKSLVILDNLLKQLFGTDIIKETFGTNHQWRGYASKIKASIRPIISHEFMIGNHQANLHHTQSDTQLPTQFSLNVNFSHIKKFEKQHKYNSKKHQLIIETAA